MKLSSHYKTAKANLLLGKVRTALAISGILVGTAAVVALLSSGYISTEAALQQFKSLGTNFMAIYLYPRNTKADISGGAQNSGSKPTEDMLKSMKYEIEEIARVAPYISRSSSASFAATNWYPLVIGANQNLAAVLGITMQQGRFINKLDKINLFCVVGQNVSKDQLHSQSVLGQQVKIGQVIFTVIGVTNTFPIYTSSSFWCYNATN